jgi:hypothetical protein
LQIFISGWALDLSFSLARVSGKATLLPALLKHGWQFFQLKLQSKAWGEGRP